MSGGECAMAMELDIWSILREPDNLLTVLLHLSPRDLRAAELVCHAWRHEVQHRGLWRRKLAARGASSEAWATALRHLGGPPLGHREAKRMVSFLTASLLPGRTTPPEEILMYRKDRSTDQDKVLGSSKQVSLRNRREAFCCSQLYVFGPAAFPLLSARDGSVVVAAARHGLGRVLVLPHERMLEDCALMAGAAEWVAGTLRPWDEQKVAADPFSRAGPHWLYVQPWQRLRKPFQLGMVPREALLEAQAEGMNKVYITEGHYDDHADHLIEYVRRGGGLIIAGHAWFWAQQRGHMNCTLLNHPGNRILTHFGIAFSQAHVETQGQPLTAHRSPLTAHHLASMDGQRHQTSEEVELSQFRQQLEGEERFKIILAASVQ